MSFGDGVKNGWLVAHKSSREEIRILLGTVERDLKGCRAKDVSTDWRFAIGYNAAFHAATAALAAAGYRASQEKYNGHAMQSLGLTTGKDSKFIRNSGAFRQKRKVSKYDIGGGEFRTGKS